MTGLQMQRQILDLQRQVERISTWDSPGEGGGKQYATFVVAASDTTAAGKANADYVCTGTNDEVEINAALNATTPSTYRRVLLLEGTFNVVVGVIVISNANTTLEGQGDGTIISCTSNGANTIIVSVTASGVHIKNLRFTTTGYTNNGAVIKNSGGSQFVVEDVFIHGCAIGIWLLNSDYSRISHCLIADNTKAILIESGDYCKVNDNIMYIDTRETNGGGIEITSAAAVDSNYNIVSNNVIFGTGNVSIAGIELHSGIGHIATGNVLQDVDASIVLGASFSIVESNYVGDASLGIQISGDSCNCSNNILFSNDGSLFPGSSGISFENYNNTVSGNFITGFGMGIEIDVAEDGLVTDNYITGNSSTASPTPTGAPGIYVVDSCERIVISDNVIRKAYTDGGGSGTNVQSYGIYIDNSSDVDIVVIDNDLRDSGTTGDFFDAGTNTFYRNYDGSTKQLSRTIATGVISVPGQGYFTLLPETGTTDDLDTINGGLDGVVIYVRNEDVTNTITLKDGTGNLDLQGADVALNAINVVQALIYDETQALWLKV